MSRSSIRKQEISEPMLYSCCGHVQIVNSNRPIINLHADDDDVAKSHTQQYSPAIQYSISAITCGRSVTRRAVAVVS